MLRKKINPVFVAYFYQISLALMCIVSLALLVWRDFESLPGAYIVNVSFDSMALIVGLILMINVAHTSLDPLHRRFATLLYVDAVAIFADIVFWLVQRIPELRIVNFLANYLFIFSGTLLSYLFWRYIRALVVLPANRERKITRLFQVILVIECGAMLLNVFTGYYFTVNEAGVYIRGGIGYDIVTAPVMAIWGIIFLAVLFGKAPPDDKFNLVLYVSIPVCVGLVHLFFYGISLLYTSVLCVLVLLYTDIQAKHERELENARTALLLGQINPHFIQNCLAAIQYLCLTEPEKASDMIVQLSGYLRSTFTLMDKEECIPFRKEMELIRFYITIQQTRFPDMIGYQEDLQVEDFDVPPLVIEPLVENAIRHGIRGRQTAGHLSITARERMGCYEIIVSDDGIGFDTNEIPAGSVGLQNVSKRLSIMARGSLNIQSVRGMGTRATVTIPKTTAKEKQK